MTTYLPQTGLTEEEKRAAAEARARWGGRVVGGRRVADMADEEIVAFGKKTSAPPTQTQPKMATPTPTRTAMGAASQAVPGAGATAAPPRPALGPEETAAAAEARARWGEKVIGGRRVADMADEEIVAFGRPTGGGAGATLKSAGPKTEGERVRERLARGEQLEPSTRGAGVIGGAVEGLKGAGRALLTGVAEVGRGFGNALIAEPLEAADTVAELATGRNPGMGAAARGVIDQADARALPEAKAFFDEETAASVAGGTIPRAAGSLAAYLTPGAVAGKVLGGGAKAMKAAQVGATALGVLGGAGAQAREAKEFLPAGGEGGEPEDPERSRKLLGALVAGGALGATEALPISQVFRRLDRLGNGVVGRALERGLAKTGMGAVGREQLAGAIEQALEEGTQELVQQAGSNAAARVLYDEARKLGAGVGEGGAVGGLLGFVMGGLSARAGRLRESGEEEKSTKPQIAQISTDGRGRQREDAPLIAPQEAAPGARPGAPGPTPAPKVQPALPDDDLPFTDEDFARVKAERAARSGAGGAERGIPGVEMETPKERQRRQMLAAGMKPADSEKLAETEAARDERIRGMLEMLAGEAASGAEVQMTEIETAILGAPVRYAGQRALVNDWMEKIGAPGGMGEFREKAIRGGLTIRPQTEQAKSIEPQITQIPADARGGEDAPLIAPQEGAPSGFSSPSAALEDVSGKGRAAARITKPKTIHGLFQMISDRGRRKISLDATKARNDPAYLEMLGQLSGTQAWGSLTANGKLSGRAAQYFELREPQQGGFIADVGARAALRDYIGHFQEAGLPVHDGMDESDLVEVLAEHLRKGARGMALGGARGEDVSEEELAAGYDAQEAWAKVDAAKEAGEALPAAEHFAVQRGTGLPNVASVKVEPGKFADGTMLKINGKPYQVTKGASGEVRLVDGDMPDMAVRPGEKIPVDVSPKALADNRERGFASPERVPENGIGGAETPPIPRASESISVDPSGQSQLAGRGTAGLPQTESKANMPEWAQVVKWYEKRLQPKKPEALDPELVKQLPESLRGIAVPRSVQVPEHLNSVKRWLFKRGGFFKWDASGSAGSASEYFMYRTAKGETLRVRLSDHARGRDDQIHIEEEDRSLYRGAMPKTAAEAEQLIGTLERFLEHTERSSNPEIKTGQFRQDLKTLASPERTPEEELFYGRQEELPEQPKQMLAGQPELFRPAAGDVQGPIARDLEQRAKTAPKPKRRDGDMFGFSSPSRVPEPLPMGRIEVAGVQGGGPIKGAEGIVREAAKRLERGIRQGAKLARGEGANYDPSSGRLALRNPGDLDALAHDLGHDLDDVFQLGAEGKDLPEGAGRFDAELAPLWVHGSITEEGPRSEPLYKRAEGIAEFFRALMVNPEAAAAAAPEFWAHVQERVPAGVLREIEAVGGEIRKFAGASATERAASQVAGGGTFDVPELKMRERIRKQFERRGWEFRTNGLWDRLLTEGVDYLRPVMKAIDYAASARGMNLMGRMDPAGLIRAWAGVEGKTERIFEFGVPMVRGAEDGEAFRMAPGTEGGISGILEPLAHGSKEEFEADSKALWAKMISERVIERAELMDKRFQTAVEELKKAVDEGKMTAREALEQRGALERQMRANKARISGQGGGVYSDLKDARRTVAELKRDAGQWGRLEEASARYRTWADAVLRYAVDKGRISPEHYANIKANNQFYVDFARRVDETPAAFMARLGNELGTPREVVRDFEGGSWTIENPLVALMAQTHATIKESDRNEAMLRFTELLTTDREMYEGQQPRLDQVGSRAQQGDKDTIRVIRGDQEEFWQFEAGVYEALKRMGEPVEGGLLVEAAKIPGRILRAGVTHSPGFIVRNFGRDTVERTIQSRTGSGLKDLLTKVDDETLTRFMLAGGGQFGNYGKDRISYYKQLKKAQLALTGEGNTIWATPGKMLAAYNRLAELSELKNRIAEFTKAERYAREKLGLSPTDAALYGAQQARDLLDFAVVGRLMRQLNSFVPFLNPRIQGLSRMVRGIQENPKGYLGRWTMYAVVPSLLTYAWAAADDDDLKEYLELPAYQRDYFWNFKVGPNLWLRIPKPFEAGMMATGVERALDRARGNERALEGFAGRAAKGALPVEFGDVLIPAIQPTIENLANYDFFRERRIIPDYEAEKPVEQRKGTATASRFGQVLQEALGTDARMIDHWVQGQFGSLGKTALQVLDLGRDDKANHYERWLSSTLGVFSESPGFGAEIVQETLDQAKRMGKTHDKRVTALWDLLDRHREAGTAEERDRIAGQIRERARGIKAVLDRGQKGKSGG